MVLLALLAFILRFVFMSPWLEDWDSVQFALALDEFSLVKHQPHPPGYPLYIILGRIINFFLGNPTASPTFLSSLAGALSVREYYWEFGRPTYPLLRDFLLFFFSRKRNLYQAKTTPSTIEPVFFVKDNYKPENTL